MEHLGYLLGLAALFIAVLAVVAGWYRHRLKLLDAARESAGEARQEAVLQGLEVLSRAVVQQQMNITEAALRISVLLDNLSDVPEPVVDTTPFRQLAEAAGDFAIGQKRQDLPRDERRQQDRDRESLEETHGPAVTVAAERLLAAIPRWREASLR